MGGANSYLDEDTVGRGSKSQIGDEEISIFGTSTSQLKREKYQHTFFCPIMEYFYQYDIINFQRLLF